MKSALYLFGAIVVLFAAVSAAQVKRPATPGSKGDSMHLFPAAAAAQAEKPSQSSLVPGPRPGDIGPIPQQCDKSCVYHGRFHRGMHGPLVHLMLAPMFLFVMGIVILFAINIILTVLVALDMAEIGRFNGLWIPVLLIIGIPGTALYALFRIGDAIAGGSEKLKLQKG